MKDVYIISDNIITSLGFTTAGNMESIRNGSSGIRKTDDPALYHSPVALSQVSTEELEARFIMLLEKRRKTVPASFYTRLEKMFILSVDDALEGSGVNPADKRTLLVVSTTKGNIDLLEDRFRAMHSHKRLYIWEMARIIRDFFQFSGTPVILSNACISGVLAIMTAARLIRWGQYDNAVVAGGDIASEFVISGFQSFQAMSPEPCRPYDLNRTGLSLGEACGTLVLSVSPAGNEEPEITVSGAATSNDANHISGPSRTGEELCQAMTAAMKEAGLFQGSISYISAHGTATPFNDEMESKAVALCNLSEVPLNSFKGYWGHTLGAAGIIESVAAIHSLRNNLLYRSAGFETPGTPEPLNIIESNREAELKSCLKIASGFGGCNAAIVFKKRSDEA
jgi:3-oxoacyl-[acyl-carrier-protein] synthase-1